MNQTWSEIPKEFQNGEMFVSPVVPKIREAHNKFVYEARLIHDVEGLFVEAVCQVDL